MEYQYKECFIYFNEIMMLFIENVIPRGETESSIFIGKVTEFQNLLVKLYYLIHTTINLPNSIKKQ